MTRVLATVVVAAVLMFVVDLVEGPFFSFATKAWAPELRGDKVIGGIEGPVKAADRETSTVRVSSGFLGLASLPLVVTPQTKIAVNGKLGAFADLDRGQRVRIAYEVLPGRLVAWRVEVLDRWATATDAVLPAEIESDNTVVEDTSSRENAAQPGAARATEPATRAAAPPATPSAPARQDATVTTPAPKRAVAAPSASPRSPVAESLPRPTPPPVASAPASRPATRPGAPASRPSDAPNASQTEDGGAVIDWLIRESPARSQ